MSDSNRHQRLSWESGPSDRNVLVYHHTADFDCERRDMPVISKLPRRIESHKQGFEQNAKEGITNEEQTQNDPELLLSM